MDEEALLSHIIAGFHDIGSQLVAGEVLEGRVLLDRDALGFELL